MNDLLTRVFIRLCEWFMQERPAPPNSFREWYRILRQHNQFTIWQALVFAHWLASGTRRPVVTRVFEHFHGEVR